MRRLHPLGGQGRKEDLRLQLRGNQARHPARDEKRAENRGNPGQEGFGQASVFTQINGWLVVSGWWLVKKDLFTNHQPLTTNHLLNMEKRKILIQLDTDSQASVFDRVVAVDAGADEVFSYGGVKPEQVRDLVHGAIFTRGPDDLKRTAIFIGGSDVAAGERLLAEVRKHMIVPARLCVSVLLDANGANTTAVAAVRAAARHGELKGTKALVLGGTGPVGQRVAFLLARQGAEVRVGSRQLARSSAVCDTIRGKFSAARLEPVSSGSPDDLRAALSGR